MNNETQAERALTPAGGNVTGLAAIFAGGRPETAAASARAEPEPEPARFVTGEKAKELADLAYRKGYSWARKSKGDRADSICHIFDLPETTMIEDLSPLIYHQIRQSLLEEKDWARSG